MLEKQDQVEAELEAAPCLGSPDLIWSDLISLCLCFSSGGRGHSQPICAEQHPLPLAQTREMTGSFLQGNPSKPSLISAGGEFFENGLGNVLHDPGNLGWRVKLLVLLLKACWEISAELCSGLFPVLIHAWRYKLVKALPKGQ